MNIDFDALSTERLTNMDEAGKTVLECQRVLHKVGENIVADLLKGCGTFYQMNHYPDGDVYDHESHGQYYYHAHREEEHGHFHLFLRPKGMPDHLKPAPLSDFQTPEGDNDALSHLVAISMDNFGLAQGLFTTNRWVTAEYWYKAEDVIEMLDHFTIDHAKPSWPVNMWITALVRLFYPQICELIKMRDVKIVEWKESHPDMNVFEDRNLEIASEIHCRVEDQIDLIKKALSKR